MASSSAPSMSIFVANNPPKESWLFCLLSDCDACQSARIMSILATGTSTLHLLFPDDKSGNAQCGSWPRGHLNKVWVTPHQFTLCNIRSISLIDNTYRTGIRNYSTFHQKNIGTKIPPHLQKNPRMHLYRGKCCLGKPRQCNYPISRPRPDIQETKFTRCQISSLDGSIQSFFETAFPSKRRVVDWSVLYYSADLAS